MLYEMKGGAVWEMVIGIGVPAVSNVFSVSVVRGFSCPRGPACSCVKIEAASS